jgi:hypothetical protein
VQVLFCGHLWDFVRSNNPISLNQTAGGRP